MRSSIIKVGQKGEFSRITFVEEILLEYVCHQDLLMARVERIQVRIGILLAHIEVHEIVLDAIVVPIAEDARSEVCVGEDESSKIRDKRLNTPAGRNEVVSVGNVADV